MPASKHQLAASAYHLKPSDLRKLLLTASNFRDRCLIKTLWWLGVRRSELINLDVRDVDVERKRVTIQKGKGGKTRVAIPQKSPCQLNLLEFSRLETRSQVPILYALTLLAAAAVSKPTVAYYTQYFRHL